MNPDDAAIVEPSDPRLAQPITHFRAPESPSVQGTSLPVAMKIYGKIARTYRKPRLMSVKKLIEKRITSGTVQSVISSAHSVRDRFARTERRQREQ